MHSAKIGGVLSYARGGFVGDCHPVAMIESEASARAAEFSMELPDGVAEPAKEPVRVDITVNNEDNHFNPDDKEFSEMLRNHIRDSIRYANGGTLIQKSIGREQDDPSPLGVYRPNLVDRKVGKVRVELVDDGFPLALREIAKVMTWAQTAKGYKDHDWQNLPNPEQGLSGATSRHRSDFIIQRQVDKLAAKDCVDVESKIIHKAHEAFGVLAQLELILRGVIK
jgi:hypothetical protein